jgi:hypothetical protein
MSNFRTKGQTDYGDNNERTKRPKIEKKEANLTIYSDSFSFFISLCSLVYLFSLLLLSSFLFILLCDEYRE